MPPLPGEERLLTLFADVHYYFQKPTNRPLRHRFDKASYFYLYYNSTRQTSRIEIANNPSTPEQDAVHGYIDKCRVTNTQRFQTRLSIEVEAEGIATSPTSPVTKDLDEWRLFNGDLRDSSREKLKVHTLDVYLWAQEDARLALDFFGKLLTPAQLDLGDVPQNRQVQGTSQQDTVSSVVKNLEDIAVSDPAYQNGQTRDSQNQPQAIPIKLPPPPPPPPNTSQSRLSARSQGSSTVTETAQRVASSSSQKEDATTTYAPMAYNPAAPAAPEPIAHREKTPPPPEDGSGGTGLHYAAHDQAYHPSQARYPQYGSPPPPPTGAPQSSTYGSPPPQSTLSGYTSPSSSLTHMSPPASAHQTRSSTTSTTAPSFAPPPTGIPYSDTSQRRSSAAETYAPAQPAYRQEEPETPNEQFYNTLSQDKRPLQHVQPRYQAEYFNPTGSAAYPQQTQSPPQNEYDVHSSVYRPTEAEAGSHRHHRPSKSSPQKQDPGSLKGLAKRFTTGVNKAIQKAESKYP